MGDNFMGARFLNGEKAETILSGLRIEPGAALEATQREAGEAMARAALRVPDEALNVLQSSYEGQARTLVVNRAEAQLVALYRSFLGAHTHRIRTAAGVTDLVHASDDGVEVVEAKATSSREAVRLAIGQIMDYVRYIPQARAMSILVPDAPTGDLIDLANRLGIDVIHGDEHSGFRRKAASDQARTAGLDMLR
jgi:5-methylcytosine-specific restriction protein A